MTRIVRRSFLSSVVVVICTAATSAFAQTAPRRWICDTAEHAGRAAGQEAHRRSEVEQRQSQSPNPNEWGGWVYAMPDGRYSFTDPVTGEPGSDGHRAIVVNPAPQLSRSTQTPRPDDQAYFPRLPGGQRVVAVYHIHPVGGVLPPGSDPNSRRRQYENEHFSRDDIAFARRYGVPGYLRTPRVTKVYDPSRDLNWQSYLARTDHSGLGQEALGTPPSADSIRRVPENPEGACEEVVPSPWARMFGDPHLVSLDGVAFDYQAAGEFIAASAPGGFQVQVRLEPYGVKPSVSFITGIALRFASRRVGIHAGGPRVLVEGRQEENLSGSGRGGRLTLSDGVQIERRPDFVEVIGPRGDRLRVRFPSPDYLDVALLLASERRGKVSGLLGDFDGSPEGEFKSRSGSVVNVPGSRGSERHRLLYREWGDGWRLSTSESLFDYAPGRTTKDYDLRQFPKANTAGAGVANDRAAADARVRCLSTGVSAGSLLEACIFDLALTGEERFLQTYRELANDSLPAGVKTVGRATAPDIQGSGPFGSGTATPGALVGRVYFIPAGTKKLPDLSQLRPTVTLYTAQLDIPPQEFNAGFPGVDDRFEWFAVRYTGSFTVSRSGVHEFHLRSDDGAIVYIDGKKVLDNDGIHGARRARSKVTLTGGKHSIQVDYFQGPRPGIALQLWMTPPGGQESIFVAR
jgi:hypothetical protein